MAFLARGGYKTLAAFIQEKDSEKAYKTILEYLRAPTAALLRDGIANPYDNSKAKWYFVAWIMRDAPAQRLNPMVASMPGDSMDEQRAYLLNDLRVFASPLFPLEECWSWPAVAEVMLARLEGSRRALKGNLFEEVVRGILRELFKAKGVRATVGAKSIRLNEETYDVQVVGNKKTILIPVKTRETMGGGHALLFTRDIHKAISVARKNKYDCIPVIIAESWGGDLKQLECEHCVLINANPNQIEDIKPVLAEKLMALLPVFKAV